MTNRFTGFALVISLYVSVSPARAQEYRATLTGQVVDTAGAPMPNVKISATLPSTGSEFTTNSGPSGEYTLPLLPPGTYTVAAETAGFKKSVNSNILLNANLHVTLNITMQVGDVTQSMTVTADASILTTASASVGQAIPDFHLEDMPSIGRAPMAMAKLAFGVVDLTNPQANSRPFDNSGTSTFTMAGGPAQTNELLLDGAPNMWGPHGNLVQVLAYNPPMDAVEEVKAEPFSADASQGDTMGGAVSLVTKGGSNQFHGSLEEFNQVGRLAASNFFSTAAGGRKLATEYNQYGVTAGAPFYIPKIYNGKNRVFWFFAYEGVKHNFPQPIITTVPTAAMRQGDFSALLALGSIYQIYNPFTGSTQSGHVARQPFPNNIIPSSLFNQVSQNYLNYYPLPNRASSASGLNDYLANTIRHDDYFTVLPRLDFVISDRHKLFWNYHAVYRTEHIQNLFGNIAAGDTRPRDGNGSTLDDLYTFTPSSFLNTRLSWNRIVDYEYRNSTLAGFNPTSLGFPSYVDAASPKLTMPYLAFSDSTQPLAYAVGGIQGAGFYTPYDTFQLFSVFNKIAGNHSIKVGADIRLRQQSSIIYGNSAGSYGFDSSWVNGPLNSSPAAPQGQAFAAFLLGLPTTGTYDLNSHFTSQSYYTAFFVQDDWRVRPNLTLNIGLRYEHETPTTERYNRVLDGFNFAAPNSVTGAAQAAYAANPIPQLPPNQFRPVGGATYASSGNPDIASTYGLALSPRFGFAYTPAGPNGKTVIRGGFGIFFATYGAMGVQVGSYTQAPLGGYSQSTPVVPTLNGYLTPYATLTNPFPTGIQQPPGAAAGLNTMLGQTLSFLNPKLAQPYSERWSFTVQRQLAAGFLVELGYIGNRGMHLPVNLNLNGVPPQYLSTAGARDNPTISALTSNVPNPFQGLLPGTSLNGSATTVLQLLRPFPQFSGDNGVVETAVNAGSSDFNSLEVRLQKRLSFGLEFITSYEHSRMMSDVIQLNAASQVLTRMIDPSDRPNRFVSSFVYQLPFGKGKAFASRVGPGLDRLVGGWEISGIVTLQDSNPLSWGNVIYQGPCNLNLNAHHPNGAFNTACFNTNASQQLADNIRTFPQYFDNLRQDSIKNFESAISKTIRVTERIRFLFRGEAFNTLNRPQFGPPALSPTQANFGQVTTQANSPRTLQFSLRILW